ncbi:MAG: endo-1,4-beta-xylanase [Opitutaceae bacterium]
MNNEPSIPVIRRPPHRIALFLFLFAVHAGRAEPPVYLTDLLGEVGPEVTATPFFEVSNAASISVSGGAGLHTREWLEIDHPKFDSFLRVGVLADTEEPYGVVLHSASNPWPINEGDWVLISFFARTSPGAEQSTGIFKGFIERSQPTWLSLGEVSGLTSGEWNRYVALGQATEGMATGAIRLSLHLGFGVQSLDLAGFAALRLEGEVDPEALPYSTITYDGMASNAAWRARAAEMIALNRMGDLKLRVTDLAGKAIEGASVEIEMEKHDYQFGTFFSRLALEQTAPGDQYREWMRDNFNYATTPVYWADWGWADPVRRGEYLDMASWLQAIGMPARGHVLIYPGWQFAPAELEALSDDPVAFNALVVSHLEEIVPLMKARGIREYDVINELRQLSDFTDIVGMDAVVGWFWKVRELDPEAKLYINENTILTDGGRNVAAQDHYFNLIQWLLDQGAPLDGIGMQGHSSEATTPPAVLWEILDRFAVFGLPIRITEYDLGTRDREGQAAYDRDFTTAVFAHPATVGMTRWGFYEPEMWRPLGALIATDGEYKPNGLAHRRLLFEDWHTRETGLSDTNGVFSCRAFFGSYRVRVSVGEASHERVVEFPHLPANSEPPVVEVTVPTGKEVSWFDLHARDGELAVDWETSCPSLRYTVETSTDLKSWRNAAILFAGSDQEDMHWRFPLADDPVFLRIRVDSVW